MGKLLSRIAELASGEPYSEDEPRADMVLPLRVLAFGLFSLVCGIASAVYAAATAETAMAVFALIFFIAAVLLTLAWRNQTARMNLKSRPFSESNAAISFPKLRS